MNPVVGQFLTIALWLTLAALLVFGLAYAFRPAGGFGRYLKETIFAFVAFYFLLFGLRMMLGPIHPDDWSFLGDLFASLALTFFWTMLRKRPDVS